MFGIGLAERTAVLPMFGIGLAEKAAVRPDEIDEMEKGGEK
jgi:hypothetical protein